MNRKEYRRPQMRVVEIQQRGLLMTSDPVRGGNSINDWKDGGTTDDDIYM